MSGVDYLLAEALPQLIWVTDAEGCVEYVNSKYEEYTGYSCAELRGHTEWRKALHPDDLERCLRAWEAATASGTVYEVEYRLRRSSDQTWRWHLTRALPVRDDDGRIINWFGTCTDIEEQKQESRRKDELLAMLGHELRNPLAPILNAVQLLRERGEHGLESDIVERQARHMARLIDDLLDVSRINSGRVQLRKEACDLGSIVDTALEATHQLIEERGHRLVVDLGAEPLVVDGDPVRLAQVLTNLLNNAAKYMDRGGLIVVCAAREREHVVIWIVDQGSGIPADELPHVFDLFVQGKRTLDRAQGGLGVGLTVVRSLVEMHGGTVTAHSEGPSRGTEIVVRIPAAQTVQPPVRRPITEVMDAVEPVGRGQRVLVVDDNADITDVLWHSLTWKGFEVHVAHNGPAALDIARAFVPDVVLLDIGLPVMNGYEVARRLRADSRLAAARLIALTGYGQDADRERARAAGFDHHLTKPVDLDRLTELVASAAVTPRSRLRRAQ